MMDNVWICLTSLCKLLNNMYILSIRNSIPQSALTIFMWSQINVMEKKK